MISAITSSFRREKKQPKQRDEEEERILGSSRPTSVKAKDTLNSTQSDYGTTSDQQFQSSSREGGRVNDENRLDGNDADVWSSVPGRGLDGRGSIRSVRTYSDDGQLGRRRHLLTKCQSNGTSCSSRMLLIGLCLKRAIHISSLRTYSFL